jgi:ribosomal-protein-alanine acetyltransferase
MMKLERENPTAAHWTRQRYDAIFKNNAEQQPRRFAWVVEQQAQPEKIPNIVGFLVAHQVDHEWELENVLVAASSQRRGVGTLLIAKFIAHVREQGGMNVFLEVRESNQSARVLYRKMGFEESGQRSNYYASPSEHAVICRLELS